MAQVIRQQIWEIQKGYLLINNWIIIIFLIKYLGLQKSEVSKSLVEFNKIAQICKIIILDKIKFYQVKNWI